MVKANWDNHGEATSHSLLDDGEYPCKLVDIQERETRKGNDMWVLTWEVIEGKSEGAKVFDNLAFVGKGWDRAKLLFSRMGRKTEGDEDLTPEMILMKTCMVTVEQSSYENKSGDTVHNNSIPFAGYAVYSPGAKADIDSDDDIPF